MYFRLIKITKGEIPSRHAICILKEVSVYKHRAVIFQFKLNTKNSVSTTNWRHHQGTGTRSHDFLKLGLVNNDLAALYATCQSLVLMTSRFYQVSCQDKLFLFWRYPERAKVKKNVLVLLMTITATNNDK